MMQFLLQIVKRFRRCENGVALIEFAFISPFVILLVLGTVELTRYVLISQKIDKAVYALADVLAQSIPPTASAAPGELNEAGLTQIFNLFDNMMRPFDDVTRQVAIATSVQHAGANNVIRWQAVGGGTLSNAQTRSVVNNAAPGAISPAAMHNDPVPGAGVSALRMNQMTANENMIVMEVFYRYEPFLADVLEGFGFIIEPATLVRRMYMRPRVGDLVHLPPSVPVV